ncbi:uncharacterized protein LACBIDRAFT_314417 [Laccaria bicolor S238N-H82]|uniref:Predicted protein n=1 Tax=Laccaria bicolor (strain S238N-H82 / ATCC MYA-4686) TaxID=486041 RepID=B0E533_LACBS|nr:uncharacterized protein LACBIDRAFT_314417 [Laccaria bicolor S238N-H82]EDQ98049.1 predicted protein [Laccaria bicolor S238N-H82]|eukprot:XP_001891301.1 predicted protein [Laccaria bicolor S238N-H82]
MRSNRRPYQGPRTQLVVSIDIGTTFSAASVCILQPGTLPVFEEILRWPKQANPDAKVSTTIVQGNHVVSVPRPTVPCDAKAEADEEGWIKAEWWKLYLRPDYLPKINGIEIEIPELPPSRTVNDIFADFLEYVKGQLQVHVTSSHGNGESL